MAVKKFSPAELKRQEEYVRACEDRVSNAKNQVKEGKADLEMALAKLRTMARGEDPDFDFAGDAEEV